MNIRTDVQTDRQTVEEGCGRGEIDEEGWEEFRQEEVILREQVHTIKHSTGNVQVRERYGRLVRISFETPRKGLVCLTSPVLSHFLPHPIYPYPHAPHPHPYPLPYPYPLPRFAHTAPVYPKEQRVVMPTLSSSTEYGKRDSTSMENIYVIVGARVNGEKRERERESTNHPS